jgi:hypothetical protein
MSRELIAMLKLLLPTLILPIFVVLTACAGGGEAQQSPRQLLETECREPRPEVCTFQYQPVCGLTEGGKWKTFSNGCQACSEAGVIGHRDGACEDGPEAE